MNLNENISKEMINRFKELNPDFTSDNKDDLTYLLIDAASKSIDSSKDYIKYYTNKRYNLESYDTCNLINSCYKGINPLIIDCSISFSVQNYDRSTDGIYLILKKWSEFKTDVNKFAVMDNYTFQDDSPFRIKLVEGSVESINININSFDGGKLKLQNKGILPNYTEFTVNDQIIDYSDYAEFDNENKCYSIIYGRDDYFYLILSKPLLKSIVNYESIKLKYLFIENKLTSKPAELEIASEVYNLQNKSYTAKINDISVKSEYENPQINPNNVMTYNQAITKQDYQKLISNHPSVKLCKLYDISDKIVDSVIEIDSNNPIIDLKVGNLDAFLPMYVYAAIAFKDTELYEKSVIVDYLKSIGLNLKEVLLDYGNNPNVSTDGGYTISKTYHPYLLPEYVDVKNSSIKTQLDPFESKPDSYPGYQMPDLVLHILNAKYLTIDITLRLEIDSDDASEIFDIYIAVVTKINEIFAVGTGNYTFNSLIKRDQIIQNVYSVSDKIMTLFIDDFKYYRNGEASEKVNEVQLAPDEIPMLGKLSVYLDYHQVSNVNPELIAIADKIEFLNISKNNNENLIANDLPMSLSIKLNDSLTVIDSIDNTPKTVVAPISLTMWYLMYDSEQIDSKSQNHEITIVESILDDVTVDNASRKDDLVDLEDNALYTDIPSNYRKEYDY